MMVRNSLAWERRKRVASTGTEHHFGQSITVLGQDYDESCNAPDIEWEHKLQPYLGIRIKAIEKAGLHTQV